MFTWFALLGQCSIRRPLLKLSLDCGFKNFANHSLDGILVSSLVCSLQTRRGLCLLTLVFSLMVEIRFVDFAHDGTKGIPAASVIPENRRTGSVRVLGNHSKLDLLSFVLRESRM